MSQPPKKGEDKPEKVVHSYHDHADDEEEENPMQSHLAELSLYRPADQNFTARLHRLLSCSDREGISHIISWQPHGRSFLVHHKKSFEEQVLQRWFHQSSMQSFLRQLNLYGFMRQHKGPDKGGYYHELFLRGKPTLARRIERTRIKGKGARKAVQHESEPDFYKMKPLPSDDGATVGPASAPPPVAQPAAAAAAAAAAAHAQLLPSLGGRGPSPGTHGGLQGPHQASLRQEDLWLSLQGHDETAAHMPILSSAATLPHSYRSLALPAPAPHSADRSSQASDSTAHYSAPLDMSQASSLARLATMQHSLVDSDQVFHAGDQEWNPSQSAAHAPASQDFGSLHSAAARSAEPASFSQPLSSQAPIAPLSSGATQESLDPSDSHLWDAMRLSGLFEPTPFPQLPSHPPNPSAQENPNEMMSDQRIFQGGNLPTLNANIEERQAHAWNQILESPSPSSQDLSHHLRSHSYSTSRMFQYSNTREEGKEGRIEEGKEGRSYPHQSDPDDRDDESKYQSS